VAAYASNTAKALRENPKVILVCGRSTIGSKAGFSGSKRISRWRHFVAVA